MDPDKKILIVDDDARNIFALRLTLQARGFKCLSARDATEGFKVILSNSVGAVLMDMMMPDIDGYEAIRYLRSNPDTAGIPVIAVTAQAMTGDKEKCLAAGASAYISKPVDVDALLHLLNNIG